MFVGINPGARSAAVGHHFAGASNRFWKLLFDSGLINEPLTHREDWRLPEWRLGLTNIIGRKMLPVVEKLSKEKGLSAVVYLNPTRDAYVDPSLIITEEVIKAYNAAYPVTGAAPAPAKKP